MGKENGREGGREGGRIEEGGMVGGANRRDETKILRTICSIH